MKKISNILLIILIVFTLVGCNKNINEEDKKITAYGEYLISNNTGEGVGGIYIYPEGGERTTNFVHQAFEKKELVEDYLEQFHSIKIDAEDDEQFAEWTGSKKDLTKFVLEFCDRDGDILGIYKGLELKGPVTIVLTSDKTKKGTPGVDIDIYPDEIKEYTMNVQFFNKTGSNITSLKAVNIKTKEEIDILSQRGVTELENEKELDWNYTADLVDADTLSFNIIWTYGDGIELSLMTNGYASHPLSFENTGIELLASNDIQAGATTVNWQYYFK